MANIDYSVLMKDDESVAIKFENDYRMNVYLDFNNDGSDVWKYSLFNPNDEEVGESLVDGEALDVDAAIESAIADAEKNFNLKPSIGAQIKAAEIMRDEQGDGKVHEKDMER